MVNVKGDDGHVVYRLKEDRTLDNVWRIPCIQPADKTNGWDHPTQKPEALLERVIEASCAVGRHKCSTHSVAAALQSQPRNSL